MSSTYLINTIKSAVTNADTEAKQLSAVVDIYKVYQKMQKSWPDQDKVILGHLKKLYGKMKGKGENEKITNEEVTRF